MPENRNSKARIAANNRYNEKAYDRINLAVPKGQKERIQAVAARQNLSINAYVGKLIDEALERENIIGGGSGIPKAEEDTIP